MTRTREFAIPAYLFACLLMGGSIQGIWSNMLLQIAGVVIIAWAAAVGPAEPLNKASRSLFLIVIAGLTVVIFQLIPLPPTVWPHLGGRDAVLQGYEVLGIATPWLPISLAPYESIATLITSIPALAVLTGILVLRAYRPLALAIALGSGAFAGVLLGALQVTNGNSKAFYLYPESSFGMAAGFFANGNHMAVLLVVAVPFLAAVTRSARTLGVQRYSSVMTLTAGALLVIVVGIALSRSIAGYGLLIPALFLSFLIVRPVRAAAHRLVLLAGAALLLSALAIVAGSPIGEQTLETSTAVQSRSTILATTFEAMKDFEPFGSGLGTFRGVYKLYENHDLVTTVVINHAHNEYAELALETGLPGILVIFAFFAWWVRQSWRAWRSPEANPYARAASASSAIILAHSLVDFPARAAALGACLAMCIALLAERRPQRADDLPDLRPTRHLALD